MGSRSASSLLGSLKGGPEGVSATPPASLKPVLDGKLVPCASSSKVRQGALVAPYPKDSTISPTAHSLVAQLGYRDKVASTSSASAAVALRKTSSVGKISATSKRMVAADA